MLRNSKDLDTTFIQYGIRKDDMVLVEMLSLKHGIDADWLRDLLRALHKERAVQDDIDDKAIERVMEQALKRLANDVETGLYAPLAVQSAVFSAPTVRQQPKLKPRA
jgi:hypothetical protein